MEFHIVRREKGAIEIEAGEDDVSLFVALVEELNDIKEVEFAAYKWEHPLLSKPRMIVKAKNPEKVLLKVLDELENKLHVIEKEIKKL